MDVARGDEETKLPAELGPPASWLAAGLPASPGPSLRQNSDRDLVFCLQASAEAKDVRSGPRSQDVDSCRTTLLMPEEEQQSRPPWWLVLWQRRWWTALATLFILVWWLVPPWLYRHTGTDKDAKLNAITDTRTALLAGLIGVGALLTFWLNSRVYRITARTLEVTEQGHITERYTKAIEQLGSDKLDVRLGGIYALERIAADSERDHSTVVEVLSAFIREHSHPTQVTAPDPTIAEVLGALLRGQSEPDEVRQASPDRSGDDQPNESAVSHEPTPAIKLPTDVQAAITVLGRLPLRPGVPRGDLSNALLAGAQLTGANLSGAQLTSANLSGAVLDKANLSRAVLDKANLSGAVLDKANLTAAELIEANLTGAKLIDANLTGAILFGADLPGAMLIGADLSYAGLTSTDLSRAGLTSTNLSGALLDRADLFGALLDKANLSGAELDRADLREIPDLTQEQLNSAHGDANTRLPDGLLRPAGWTPDQSSRPTSS